VGGWVAWLGWLAGDRKVNCSVCMYDCVHVCVCVAFVVVSASVAVARPLRANNFSNTLTEVATFMRALCTTFAEAADS